MKNDQPPIVPMTSAERLIAVRVELAWTIAPLVGAATLQWLGWPCVFAGSMISLGVAVWHFMRGLEAARGTR